MKIFKVIIITSAVIVMAILYTSCDYIAAGSNLMAERYEFSISQDSLMNVITNFNTAQGLILEDSTFKTEGNPYYLYGVLVDRDRSELYHVGLHKTSSPTTLLLFSVENTRSGEIFGINHEPVNKEEIKRRNAVIKNFEQRVLDKLGSRYVRKGNAMKKIY